ncbi:MAG: tryptophan 2,3-dioxygenase [Bacteroidetes bacterium]|nr:MAG: tryptophan 2,3-dioxygenase [Bacteroidota bacterium]REK04789.1 MAG: tryptophan 2,3-dioxygenase [Bacteroidota bacterium]REK36262.1 MAG: tryptophan 2,3-dioxygenase [Bacteroidota bacterium]REK51074.1 MAG: tryptophan 2,3-dioxygenase [Bacteroidota bacterium]
MELKPEMIQKLEELEKKYSAMGQDLMSYLDGLLYADYLTYWDYIHVDTLLSLQNPKTSIPDEEIFIMYHQITELYFKLCLHEMKQLSEKENLDAAFFLARIKRINAYFDNLVRSFDIMVDGMEQEQFLKFRMSLLPASGFQSAQYRMIEIYATDFIRLVDKNFRDHYENTESGIEEMFTHIYWKAGATELASGKKTLTLKQFEDKYSDQLIQLAKAKKSKNLWQLFLGLPEKDRSNPELRNHLKFLDLNVNVNWPLSHYKSAVRYLQRDPEDIKATGGTNWQKYLPPRFQKRVFYPSLFTEVELTDWGKTWVDREVLGIKG